ncbi:MAG: MobF family relaxase [Xenococcaceae cyanobacterium MO_188.B19]|nr:MobF family relaxase [Xenococcaceae cyanobacterium MO_188.B19]
MLSINTVTSGIREKEEYYTEDESLTQSKEKYYSESESQDKSQAKTATQNKVAKLTQAVAYGKGAAELGLTGSFSKEDFKSLFYGFKPGSQERIRGHRPNGDTQERLAEDLTFSAPKSVSMALHLNGDNRLFDAHTEAVKFVLDEVEQRYIQTRIQVNGERKVVNTGNLTAALIPHHTSRDGDMQLHTHAVVFNGTKGADGKWRALHNDAIANQEWLGHLYQQKLAQKVQQLGYSIYETKNGFELEGISPHDIKVFSKRSVAIINQLKQEGKEINHANRDEAALTTRKAKNISQTLTEYQHHWQQEAKANKIKAPKAKTTPVAPLGKKTASQLLNSAIAHLNETSVSLERDDIYKYVYRSGIQNFKLSELDQEISTNKELLTLKNDKFTTVKALQREIKTVKQWMKGQGKRSPLLDNPNLEGTLLNSGQKEAISRTLTSTDTHQIIHGLSGVGKTTALGVLRQQLKGSKVEIKGFSPTIEAAAKLESELKIKTNTVAHLVLSKPDNKPHQLWIIDEAGMMSAKGATAILDKADSVGARILLVGDKGQNSSIEAGSPLRSLISHGATTHSISKILRQQNTIQKQAVELIAEGNGKSALELLNTHGYVTEIEDREERSQSVAKQYLELSDKEREQTLIVTGTNKERRSITQEIRKGLKTEGKLGESVKAVQLVSRNLSKEQSKQINNYETGDYIKLHREYKGTPLQKGKLYKVEGIEGEHLLLSSHGGRNYRFDPSKFRDKQVFTSDEIELAVGDQLRWTAGADKHLGQINGKQVTVTNFNSMSMNVMDNQGKTQEVSLLKPLPLDYNLVSTSYRAQGKSKKRVIVSATSDPTSSLEPFYVKISRQTKDLTVYTQNLEKLRKWVEHSNAQENPLELIKEYYDNQQRTHDSHLSVKSAESTNQRTIGDHRNPELTNPRTDINQQRASSLSSPRRTQPVYPTVDPSPTETEKQRVKRIDPRTNQLNSVSLQQNSFLQLNLSRYQGENTRVSLAITESLSFNRLEDLATAITNAQAEDELRNAISGVNVYLQEFEQKLKLEELDAISHALDEWQLGQQLAHTIQIADETEHKYQDVILAKIESQNISQPDIQQLIKAIEQWHTQQDLTTVISGASEAISHLYERINSSPEYKFENLEQLANAISQQQASDVIAEHLSIFQEASKELKHTVQEQLDRLIDSVNIHPVLAQSTNPQLLDSVSSLREQRTRSVFWQPEYPDILPRDLDTYIDEKHWSEFKKSAIHPDLVVLNAETIQGNEVYERLLSDKLAKLGSGQVVTQPMKRVMMRYDDVADGGWWGNAGIDALSLVDLEPGEKPDYTDWGCFKPDTPRIDTQKSATRSTPKYRKYENPANAKRVPFLPDVSSRLAEKIYQKHGINPTAEERESGFWYVVKQYPQIPITITEGFKKTLSSLSQGEVTIGLTGVNHIYRSTDDDKKKLAKRQLNPEVAVFANPEREFRFAYDQDTKVKTIINVRRDMVRGIELLEERGCNVKVLKWNSEDGKGLDDLISQAGPIAYAEAHRNAVSSDLDKKIHYRTEYNKLAKRVKEELGDDLSSERLDLEVYIRSVLKGDKEDGTRVVGESDQSRLLKQEKPQMVKPYLEAISHVAGTYKSLSDKNTPKLDYWAKKMLKQQTAKFKVKQDERLEKRKIITKNQDLIL